MKPIYQQILPTLKGVAFEHGYALALHGSAERDLDVIAVPWVDGAMSAAELAEALAKAVDGVIYQYVAEPPDSPAQRNPVQKPHGRLAWSIQLWRREPEGDYHQGYIDLSVMPRQQKGVGNALPLRS